MKELLLRLDALWARIPADSIWGRGTKRELADHLADAVAAKTAAGQPFERALAEAADDFVDGTAAEGLERDYYRDYVHARYWAGLVDRDVLARPDRLLLRLGAGALGLGLLLYLLVPTVAAYATSLGVAWTFVNLPPAAIDAAGDGALASILDFAAGYVLPDWLRAELWGAVAAVGLLAFAGGGAWTLQRARVVSLGHPLAAALFGLLPVAGVGFALAARPGAYSEAMAGALVVAADPEAARQGLWQSWVGGLSLLAALAACAAVVAVMARSRRRADTVGLRQAAVGVALVAAGSLLLSHPVLASTLAEQATGDVPPARLSAALRNDLALFVGGVVAVATGLRGLARVADDAQRVLIARGR